MNVVSVFCDLLLFKLIHVSKIETQYRRHFISYGNQCKKNEIHFIENYRLNNEDVNLEIAFFWDVFSFFSFVLVVSLVSFGISEM